MQLQFQSLCSSSSGNCLLVKNERTVILIDCGIKTQYGCRDLLKRHVGNRKLDAVIVSHAHGDHICYSSLAVLDDFKIPVHCHGDIINQVHSKHIRNRECSIRLRSFSNEAFGIGDLEIQPVELPHDPEFLTHGFVIRFGRIKLVVATDFHDADGLADHLVDADCIFIEANHDPELLKENWNFASTFHLDNPKTGYALCAARKSSRKPPRAVMLGHLSSERNTKTLAVDTVREVFRRDGVEVDFTLEAARRYRESRAIRIF